MKHETSKHHQVQASKGGRKPLIIAHQSSKTRGPGKRAFHHPSPWQQDKAAFGLGQFDDFQLDTVLLGLGLRDVARIALINEVEHIKSYGVRRRLLEVSNMTYGIPIICASCDPHRWTFGDSEVAGRWNDYFRLDLYKNERLQQLLLFINLLLPFPKDSFVTFDHQDTKGQSYFIEDTLVASIQTWTRGKLRDVMLLVVEASKQAIQERRPCLDAKLLEKTWKSIQSKPLEEE